MAYLLASDTVHLNSLAATLPVKISWSKTTSLVSSSVLVVLKEGMVAAMTQYSRSDCERVSLNQHSLKSGRDRCSGAAASPATAMSQHHRQAILIARTADQAHSMSSAFCRIVLFVELWMKDTTDGYSTVGIMT